MLFDAVLIDFYGTVSAGDRDAVEAASRRTIEEHGLKMSVQDFAVRWGEHFFAVIDGSNHGSFQSLLECERISLGRTLAEFGVSVDGRLHVTELERYWENPAVYQDALELLDALRVPVCCVSNADSMPLYTAIERNGLKFAAVITSHDVRCYKPDAEIFRAALDLLGVRAARTLHIGDSLHSDVGGAARLGIATAWIRRDQRVHDIGIAKPIYTIDTLTDVFGILGA